MIYFIVAFAVGGVWAIRSVGYFIAHCDWKNYSHWTDYIKLFFFHCYYNKHPVNFEFDKKLRQAIIDKLPVTTSEAMITIGGVTVWGRDFSYSYGCLMEVGCRNICPTKRTAIMLRAYVKEQTGIDGDLIAYHDNKKLSDITFK